VPLWVGNEKALHHARLPPASRPPAILRICRKEKARVVACRDFAMLENFGLVISFLSILSGSALLYDAATSADANAIFRLLGGAAVLTAGIVTAALVVRSKLHWRQIQKQNRPRL